MAEGLTSQNEGRIGKGMVMAGVAIEILAPATGPFYPVVAAAGGANPPRRPCSGVGCRRESGCRAPARAAAGHPLPRGNHVAFLQREPRRPAACGRPELSVTSGGGSDLADRSLPA